MREIRGPESEFVDQGEEMNMSWRVLGDGCSGGKRRLLVAKETCYGRVMLIPRDDDGDGDGRCRLGDDDAPAEDTPSTLLSTPSTLFILHPIFTPTPTLTHTLSSRHILTFLYIHHRHYIYLHHLHLPTSSSHPLTLTALSSHPHFSVDTRWSLYITIPSTLSILPRLLHVP